MANSDNLVAESTTWAESIRIPEQKQFGDKLFPLVLAPRATDAKESEVDEFLTNVTNSREWLDAMLFKYGAILFRGFPTKTAAEFDAFVNAFHYDILPYVGGAAVRRHVVGNVYTTNESPPDQLIPFHHEMAQVPNPPSKLFFMCDVPPAEGGETPLLLSHELYRRAYAQMPEFMDKLEAGVKYVRYLPAEDDHTSPIGRGWKSTFLTNSKEEAEQKQLAQGGRFEWKDDIMRIESAVLPAIRVDERSGNKTFFNSVVAAYTGWKDSRNDPERAVVFGDDTLLDRANVMAVQSIMDEIKVSVPWQNGDVFLVDNRTVMHSRNHFTPPRNIYAILIK